MRTHFLNLIQDPKLYQYIIVGGLCAALDISLFLLLRQYIAMHYLGVATLSFMVATFVNYILCTRFVFKQPQRRSVSSRFLLTYFVSGIGLTIHHICLFLAFEWFALPLILAKLFAMGIAFGWNFLSRKHIVFPCAPADTIVGKSHFF